MSVFDEKEYNSDDEINKKQHARLLDDVLQLDQRPFLKKPARTEPTTHVSEFNLVKTTSFKNAISVTELAKSLPQKSKHAGISKKLKSAQKAHTLRKPLEKPQAERIRRLVGFNKTKFELNKWNSIVEKNRVASQLRFPLNQGEVDFIDSKNGKKEPIKRYKSELDIALENLKPKVETIHVQEKFPFSMQEIIQRRKEMSKLRAHQSYQEAKAYKRNKIKSKKYHRIQRKEKLRLQIKEFELLQKTDPEEALRKLEQIEKTRAEERMSLRHRSTGAWAKNKQIRAKYDKDSRKALAQQLTLSRELTQKRKVDDSDSGSEAEIELPKNSDSSNPWVSNKQPTEVDDFISGYRKYWDEKNQKDNIKSENKPAVNSTKIKVPEKSKINKKNKEIVETKNKTKKSKNKKSVKYTSSWVVTPLSGTKKSNSNSKNQTNIEDIFENLEKEVRSKAKQKITALQKSVEPAKKRKFEEKYVELDYKSDLVFPREKEMRPDLDDELKNNELVDETSETIEKLQAIADTKHVNISNIDPSKFIEAKTKVKITELDSKLPDVSHEDDNSESADSDEEFQNQKQFIAEAFADDDVVKDFTEEKKEIIENDRPKDIDLNMPGWGDWGGKNLKPSKRKQKRLIIKMPKELPRKDQNKGNLIINDEKNTQIKKHQISDIPFPFTSVKDFEASIRAPIGDTFIPQTAFRRLIKPSVVTKKGAIIEPMNESILLKQKFTQNGFLVNK